MSFPLIADNARRVCVPVTELRKGDKIETFHETADGPMTISPVVKRIVTHPSKPDLVRIIAVEPKFKELSEIRYTYDFSKSDDVTLVV